MELQISLVAAHSAIARHDFAAGAGMLRIALAQANRMQDRAKRARMRSRIVTALNHIRGL